MGKIFESLFMLLFCSGFSLLFLIPVYKARKWSGLWGWAALVPLLVMGFVVLRIVVDTFRDPTSHNLWPFEIVMFGLGSLLYMGVLALLRRLTQS